jgi:DNA helicase-2/ATP-dependent DNA helicase PcrA
MNAILAELTPKQREAATLNGPVLVIAGAGTGKTRTLTAAVAHRVTECAIPSARVLAVTFTNKAAAEMTGRIRAALGDDAAPRWIGTFHGLGARQLRIEPEVADLRPGFDIMDADDTRRMVRRVMKAMNVGAAEDDVGGARDPVKLVCNRISQWKDQLVTPADAPAAAEDLIAQARAERFTIDPSTVRATARVYAEYQRTLRDANAADFGDLLLWPVLAMMRDPTYRARWAGKFACVLADEYQDVNRAQYTWLRLLSQDHHELFCVGDDDQSIYSWRGADIAYIRRFTQDFLGAAIVRLEENFRSTGHILNAANALIARDRQRLGKTLYTRKPDGTPIEILHFRNDEAEAGAIVTEIVRRRAEGVRWDDIAILYRRNTLSRVFEETLLHARVPFALVGDVGFYQRAEIKDALALLRLVSMPDDRQADEAFRRVINMPPRGFGPKAMTLLEQEAAWRQVALLHAIETAPLPPKARSAALAFADAIGDVARQHCATVADQLSLVLDSCGYRRMLRESRAESTEGRLDNVQELIRLAGQFHSARDLLDHAALATGGPNDDTTNVVKLMSLHRAKGLEFGHIFLPAWENGVFPPTYALDFAEERRLAYVALTRGMERVTISHCAFRHGPARPSDFLKDIPPQHRVDGWLRHPPAQPARSPATTPNASRLAVGSL